MKSFKVCVCKDSVFEEVAKTTSYVGSKLLESVPGAYHRIYVTDASREMLERFYVEGCRDISSLLGESHVASMIALPTLVCGESCDDFEVSFSVSEQCNMDVLSGIKDLMHSYLVYVTLGKWYAISFPDKSEESMHDASMVFQELSGILHLRIRPSRPDRTSQL